MALDEKLNARVREIIARSHKKVAEKKMFGGVCFMVNAKMCITVKTERLMFRIGPEEMERALKKEGCRPTVMRGKIMKGYVFVDPEVLKTKKQLEYWVDLALEYNATAKSSKK